MLNALMMLTAMIIQLQSPLLSDDEWVAEGWEITDRETYSILDYVEPYSVTDNGISEYFMELCFTEEGEFRAAIAGENEVVFFSDVGSRYSVTIPQYRNISLSPNNFLAVASDYGNNQYLINAMDEVVSQLDITHFFFTWFVNNSSQITGIGRNSLVFCDNHGEILNVQEFDYTTGRPTFVQWSNASEGNMIVVLNGIEYLIEAYSVSGELLWSLNFPYASAGTVPLAVSADGSCTAVSQSGNGFIVLNADGEIIDHYLENYYLFSLDVSPEGNCVAASASRNTRGKPELYVFNIQDGTSSQIEIPSEQWLPSVRSVTDDGTLLCGYNHANSNSDWRTINGRRLALYDNTGNLQWTSVIYDANEVNNRNIKNCYTLPVQINARFAGQIISCIDGYRLCYFNPVIGEIVSFHIMNN